MCWAFTGSSTAACASPPSGATSYAYDHAGNRTTGAAYDALSRATTMGSSTLSYLTPGNQELTGYGTTTFQNNLLGLDRELPSGTSAVAYTRAPNGTPLAQRTTATKQYLFGDQLGSITALADDNATTLTRTYAYTPDGNRTTTSTGTGSGATTNLGYAAGHLLPSGLYHYSARYYDPNTARWTQTDPLDQFADAIQVNKYVYSAGNPLNLVDPSGMGVLDFLSDAASSVSNAVKGGLRDVRTIATDVSESEAFKTFGRVTGAASCGAGLAVYEGASTTGKVFTILACGRTAIAIAAA